MEGYGKRVKFELVPANCIYLMSPGAAQRLSLVAEGMEKEGCAPVLADGKVAGNLAIRFGGGIIVTRSGKESSSLGTKDFAYIESFDTWKWRARYVSSSPGIKPSSDTPLYWAALVEAPEKLGWHEIPGAAVHGHSLETEEAAKKLSIPISARETEFSTFLDKSAFYSLLMRSPYPKHKMWIRKGHGFFAAGDTIEEAFETAKRYMQAYRQISA